MEFAAMEIARLLQSQPNETGRELATSTGPRVIALRVACRLRYKISITSGYVFPAHVEA
jgi:hypothetical protein